MESYLKLEVDSYRKAASHIVEKPEIKSWILKGETGTGKTVNFPRELVLQGKKVFVCEPTRLAIYSAYGYLTGPKVIASDEFKSSIGTAVDSQKNYNNDKLTHISNFIRNETNTPDNKDTKLVFCINAHMEKIARLLVEYCRQNEGSKSINFCDVIIVDECHENRIEQEMIIRYFNEIYQSYPNIKMPTIIKMSATYDAPDNMIIFRQKLKPGEVDSLGNIVSNRYKTFVDTFFTNEFTTIMGRGMKKERLTKEARISNILSKVHEVVMQALEWSHKEWTSRGYELHGTFLVFLPSKSSITYAQRELEVRLKTSNLFNSYEVLVAHGSCSTEELNNLFLSSTKKIRIVLSTNIAESSITIPDVIFVIDTGLKRDATEGDKGTTTLTTTFISKKSVHQRASRTGRDTNGVALLMMTEDEYERLQENDLSDVVKLSIHKQLISIVSLGLNSFSFFSDLNIRDKITQGLNELCSYCCISKKTDYYEALDCGKFVIEIPLSVKSSIIVYKGYIKSLAEPKYNMFPEIVIATAIDYSQSIFKNNREVKSYPLMTILEPYMMLIREFQNAFPASNKLFAFCKKWSLEYDMFVESLKRMKETYNFVTRNPKILATPVMFQPNFVFRRLLNYAPSIYLSLKFLKGEYRDKRNNAFDVNYKYMKRSSDMEEKNHEIFAISLYKIPDSRNSNLKVNNFIPKEYYEPKKEDYFVLVNETPKYSSNKKKYKSSDEESSSEDEEDIKEREEIKKIMKNAKKPAKEEFSDSEEEEESEDEEETMRKLKEKLKKNKKLLKRDDDDDDFEIEEDYEAYGEDFMYSEYGSDEDDEYEIQAKQKKTHKKK